MCSNCSCVADHLDISYTYSLVPDFHCNSCGVRMLLDMDEDEVPVMGLDDTSFFIPVKKIARVIPTNPTRKAPECCTQAFVLGVASKEGTMKPQVSRNGLPAACRVVDVGANAFVEVVADPRTHIRASAQVAVLNTATGVVQLDTEASNRIGLYGEWGGKVLDPHDPLDVVFVQMSDPNSTVPKGMRYLVPVDFEDAAASAAGQDTPNVFWWTSSYEDEGCLAASKSLVSLPCDSYFLNVPAVPYPPQNRRTL